ncbi:MAG: hypothetical protein R3C14_48740 [Caldilineaceae bacterium]
MTQDDFQLDIELEEKGAEAFAATIGRHPGLVAGRLKHEAIWEWRWHRALQVDVDEYLMAWVDRPVDQWSSATEIRNGSPNNGIPS